MSIIIKEIDGENWLFSVSHTPVNLRPFTHPNDIQDCSYSLKIGRVKYLCELELDKEYDLDCYEDFVEVERISQVKHSDGLIYDDRYLMPAKSIYW